MNDKIKILIVSDVNDEIKKILLETFKGNANNIDFAEAHSIDEAVETLVFGAPDLTFVYDVDTGKRTLDLLNNIAVTGVKNDLGVNNSIVAVVSPDTSCSEEEIMTLGGKGLISIDADFNEVLSYIVRFTIEMKKVKASLRADKEDLIRQLLEMRDTREREAELNYELAGIAEELTLVKNELEDTVDAKNKLFSIIAHDLRAPFQPLLGYTQMLSSEDFNFSIEEMKGHAKTAHEAGGQVYRLLENLLEWSMVHIDNTDYVFEAIDLNKPIDDTFAVLNQLAKDKNITLVKNTTDTITYCDQNSVSTVIRNLVSNALKFTNKGGRVEVTTQLLANKPEFLEVKIIDNGVGMSINKISGLFNFKKNIKSTGTNGEPGSGLGLSLCKELVVRNGGEISIHSEIDKGTTISFILHTKPKSD